MVVSLGVLSKQGRSPRPMAFPLGLKWISKRLGKGPSADVDCTQYSGFSRVPVSHFQCFRVKVPAPPLPGGWRGLGVGERSNIHAGGSFAWGVTRADSLYPKLKLEVPVDGLGFFSKVWRGAGRCLGVSWAERGRGMGGFGGLWVWAWDGAGKSRQGVCGEEEGESGNLKGRGWTFHATSGRDCEWERSPGPSVTITSQGQIIPKASV